MIVFFCIRFLHYCFFFFFQAEDGIRDGTVTGVQTCALPIFAIIEPAPGAVVASGLVLVRGTVAGGGEVGVAVNGVTAAVQGSVFAAMVPASAPSVALTAVATTSGGASATTSVTVSVTDPAEGALSLRPSPRMGGAPLLASFSLLGGRPLLQ